MNVKNLIILLLAFPLLFCILSCKDDDKQTPIKLKGLENDYLNLIYPATYDYPYTITGGDGYYTVHSSDESVLEVFQYNGQNLAFKPLKKGHAMVFVKDYSNNCLMIDVNVTYSTRTYIVEQVDVKILGEKLTENDIKELKNKALSITPAQVNSTYTFEYINKIDETGDITIYPKKDQTTGTTLVGTFKMTTPKEDEKQELEGTLAQVIKTCVFDFNGEKEKMLIALYYYDNNSYYKNNSQSKQTKEVGPKPKFYFIKDITQLFKNEYPALEKIYTVQTVRAEQY